VILDVAVRLFASQGFESTTMAQVGAESGLSRGAPAYFFGSKKDLYRAALGQVFSETQELIAVTLHSGDPETSLKRYVTAYIEWISQNPDYVALVQRDALDGGEFLRGLPEHLASIAEGLASLDQAGGSRTRSRAQTPQLLISVIALCWFPFTHPALARDLGLDPFSREFARDRSRHVIELLLPAVGHVH
jgi:AcrR family transcriptional regulator